MTAGRHAAGTTSALAGLIAGAAAAVLVVSCAGHTRPAQPRLRPLPQPTTHVQVTQIYSGGAR